MPNSNFSEQYFDSILNQALKEVMDEEIEKTNQEFFSSYDQSYKESITHRLKIKNTLRKYDNQKANKRGHKAVAALALMLLLTIGTTTIANANLFSLFQRLGLISNEYADFNVLKQDYGEMQDSILDNGWSNIYLPMYISSGYERSHNEISRNAVMIFYNNESDDYIKLTVFRLGNGSLYSVDNENAINENLKINGFDGVYFENDNSKTVSYNDNNYVYIFEANEISKNELIKIADSLNPPSQ